MRIPLSVMITSMAMLTACGQGRREISGRVDTTAYSLRRGAVVLAQSRNKKVYASSLTERGAFRLSLPTEERYRLLLAERTPGGFKPVSRIRWNTGAGSFRWARLQRGSSIQLGTINPTGRSSASIQDAGEQGGVDEQGTANDVDDGEVCDGAHGDGAHDDGAHDNGEHIADGSGDAPAGDHIVGDEGLSGENNINEDLDCAGTDAGGPSVRPDGGTPSCGGQGATCATTAECCLGFSCTSQSCLPTLR